jgi:predicted RNase H-like nuclease (RuvC/YqgF family)
LNADGPLEIHQLSTAATELKLKIQKARRAVLALPDIDRTCEDQQEEIDDLEEKIASLKKVLRGLGQPFSEAAAMGVVSHSKETEEMDEDNAMSMVG